MNNNEIFISSTKDPTSMSRFKEDIVNALYQIEDKMNNKVNSLESLLASKLSVFESRINYLDQDFTEVVNKQNEFKKQTEAMINILPIQTKHKESILSHEIQLNTLQKDITNACYKYDKIFLDNLILPGQIGEYCKYKNLRECLDYMLTQITQLNTYKDKATCEYKQFREKSEQNIKGIYSEFELVNKSNMNYTKNQIGILQINLNEKIEEYANIVKQNVLTYKEEEKSMKVNSIELKENINKLMEMKQEIEDINNNTLKEVRDINSSAVSNCNQIRDEVDKLNQYYIEIYEFIKDLKCNYKNNKRKETIYSKISTNDLIDDDNNIHNTMILSENEGIETQIKNQRNSSITNTMNTKRHPLLTKNKHYNINHFTNHLKTKANFQIKKNISLDNIVKQHNIQQGLKQNSIKNTKIESKGKRVRNSLTISTTMGNQIDLINTKQIDINMSKPDLFTSASFTTNNTNSNPNVNNIDKDKRFHSLNNRKSLKNKKRVSVIARNYSASSDNNIKPTERNNTSFNETLKIISIPAMKPREHIITKMTKDENGLLIKTSASCYFNPNKVI